MCLRLIAENDARSIGDSHPYYMFPQSLSGIVCPICDMTDTVCLHTVDDFRSVSAQMLDDHFKDHSDQGRIGRVEYLPVRWHSALHGDATGIDR